VSVPVPESRQLVGRIRVGRVLRDPDRGDHRRRRGARHLGQPPPGTLAPSRPEVNRALAVLGILCVAAALTIIWIARLTIPRDLYVSELGATGMPTARAFQVALVLIVIGGVAIGW